jgi:acetyl esterase/lipase
MGCVFSDNGEDGNRPDRSKIAYGADPAQFGWLTVPTTATGDRLPVVVLVHGGFWSEPWDYTLMNDLGLDLVDRGCATWNIEYRRLRGRGGWPQTTNDVSDAIDHLQTLAATHRLDLDRVLVIGHSSGGHLGLWALGRTDPVVEPMGAAGLAAVVDLTKTRAAQDFLGGTVDQLPAAYAAAEPTLDPARSLLVHGADDTTVPVDTLAAATDASVPVITVPDTDHDDFLDPTTPGWAAALDAIANKFPESCLASGGT